MDKHKRGGFTITITSLEDFAAFVALIRGEQDADKIREMTARLMKATQGLDAAVKADAPPT